MAQKFKGFKKVWEDEKRQQEANREESEPGFIDGVKGLAEMTVGAAVYIGCFYLLYKWNGDRLI